jgi:hypothetical protein
MRNGNSGGRISIDAQVKGDCILNLAGMTSANRLAAKLLYSTAGEIDA